MKKISIVIILSMLFFVANDCNCRRLSGTRGDSYNSITYDSKTGYDDQGSKHTF